MEFDRHDVKDAAAGAIVGQTSAAGWQAYAVVVSRAQGYELDEAQLARVVAQLELISGIAAPLL
ncbi:MAG TPA: AtzG-like protein, partial [Rhodocyclaceae bacterium]|nr:AtzG-like protein [Rhodocyclaceae bacterium]